jgi:hypothetical protein
MMPAEKLRSPVAVGGVSFARSLLADAHEVLLQ